MSGYARISASLVLTLAIWSPAAIHSLLGGAVDVQSVLIRFLVVFTLSRLAMRGIDRLIRVYTEHNGSKAAEGTPPVDVDDVSVVSAVEQDFARRRSDTAEPGGPSSPRLTLDPTP